MEYLFDTANIEEIKKYSQCFPITGVTSNPSILKKEGKIDLFEHFKAIRNVIGKEKSLHIQVLAENYQGILEDAYCILENVDNKVYIKIPITTEGLKAIQKLKSKSIFVTGTAIYTKMQGYLAMEAGADYIAPYYNRMENLNINPKEVIGSFAKMIDMYGYKTKILAASFKNMEQVNSAFEAGAQTATMGVDILTEAFKMPSIQMAVDGFRKDWESVYGAGTKLTDFKAK